MWEDTVLNPLYPYCNIDHSSYLNGIGNKPVPPIRERPPFRKGHNDVCQSTTPSPVYSTLPPT